MALIRLIKVSVKGKTQGEDEEMKHTLRADQSYLFEGGGRALYIQIQVELVNLRTK